MQRLGNVSLHTYPTKPSFVSNQCRQRGSVSLNMSVTIVLYKPLAACYGEASSIESLKHAVLCTVRAGLHRKRLRKMALLEQELAGRGLHTDPVSRLLRASIAATVSVSKSLRLCLLCNCSALSPKGRFTMRPRFTPGRSFMRLAQAITFL